MQMVAPSQPLGASEACRPLARLRPEAPEAVFRQDPVLPAPDSPACPTHRPRYTFVGALTPLLCLKFVLEETWPRAARIGAPDPQRTAGWGWGGGSRHLPSWPQCPSASCAEPALLPRCPLELMFGVRHSPWTWDPRASRSGWTGLGALCAVCTPRPEAGLAALRDAPHTHHVLSRSRGASLFTGGNFPGQWPGQ